MNCQWLAKISLLMDDELPANELDAVRAHLITCQQCSRVHDDFLALRDQLNQYQTNITAGTKNAVLNKILRSDQRSSLQKRVLIPAPLFALIMLVMFFVGLLTMRLLATSSTNLAMPQNRSQIDDQNTNTKSNATNIAEDFTKFDQGKRAAIKIIKRSSSLNNGVTQ